MHRWPARESLIHLLRFAGLAVLLAWLPLRAVAALNGADICEQVAQQASAETGVPAEILAALTLTETGRRRDGEVRPWAWSVNAEGAGTWFDDPAAALRFAQDRVAQGRTNVDIGCFQINFRWHGENFASVGEMFDPLANARYAARFVANLHAEMGDWRTAAGAFHSRRPQDANRYLARFDQLLKGLRNRRAAGTDAGPETYNSFTADAGWPPDSLPAPSDPFPVERLTLLGLPLDTPGTGAAGSLAVIGTARGGLLSQGGMLIASAAGPLIGGGPP